MRLRSCSLAIALLLCEVSCGLGAEDEAESSLGDAAVISDASTVVAAIDAGTGGANPSGVTRDAGSPSDSATDAQAGTRASDAGSDVDATASRDGSAAIDSGTELDATSDGSIRDSSSSGASEAGTDSGGRTCDLPATFRWTGSAPLAQPKNGAVSMKDFAHAFHKGQHIVYFTTFQTSWGSGMMTFKDWPEAAAAPQIKTSFGVAPTLFYFTPKDVWVLAYQWGPHKFSYRTSVDPSNASGWSAEKSLYNTALPPNGTGPIDQTLICDSARCYLYYAGDNGHIYKSSMPIASFPGEFPAAQDIGIVGTPQNLFEAVQVYKLQGTSKYLMIVEAQGAARYFRAWTATSLEGPWSLLTNDFAVKKNVTFSTNWTNDISHGDIVRTSPDETFSIDPCNLQMVFQGRDPGVNTDYGRLPYRLGLITLQR